MTPCFDVRLVQEGNQLHYLADRAGIRGLFSDVDAYHLDQVLPLPMKQLKLMPASNELSLRYRYVVTLYAKGLTCEADTLGSYGYVYLAVYPTSKMENQLSRIALCYGLVFSPRNFPIFISAYQKNLQYESIICITRAGGQLSPVSC